MGRRHDFGHAGETTRMRGSQIARSPAVTRTATTTHSTSEQRRQSINAATATPTVWAPTDHERPLANTEVTTSALRSVGAISTTTRENHGGQLPAAQEYRTQSLDQRSQCGKAEDEHPDLGVGQRHLSLRTRPMSVTVLAARMGTPGGLIGTRASARRPPPTATQREDACRESAIRSDRKNTG